MAAENPNRQAGDLILDRHMPQATAEEREAARQNLRAFAAAIVGIAKRITLEEEAQAARTNGHCTVDLGERPVPHP